MANPRQRRKVRSSSHKPVKQSRRANKLLKKPAPIKAPKLLQDAWDKRKTVRQNYATLGLAHSLTPTDSGGRDITRPISAQFRQNAGTSPEGDKPGQGEREVRLRNEILNTLNEHTKDGKLPRGFGRIVRDDSGAVVDVVLADEEMTGGEDAAKDRGLEEFAIGSSSGQPEKMGVSGWLLENNDKEEDAEREDVKELLRALEAASKGSPKTTRTSSPAEIKYLSRLIEKHGMDYDAMAKDRKRNGNQYSAGQLKKAIEKAKLGG